jgi:putative FmdB family regulatory protein
MPIYEYECEACGKTTEALRPMAQADEKIACEHCGSKKTHRAQSVFAASTAGSSNGSANTPMQGPGCGRCGDPRGSCGFN